MIAIDVTNQQDRLEVDVARLKRAAVAVLGDAGVDSGAVSIAIVDDPTIHDLNRRFLKHDYPTDVLSFLLERSEGSLEGEVIVSADTAVTSAAQFGWPATDELLLYVIHGLLHLVGHDDHADSDRARMRAQERHYLVQLGVEPRDGVSPEI